MVPRAVASAVPPHGRLWAAALALSLRWVPPSHGEHARHLAQTLLELAEGKAPDYQIADPCRFHPLLVPLSSGMGVYLKNT